MSLFDVITGKQSFGSWVTGRSPKESDVYANYDKVTEVTDTIRKIATVKVGEAQDAVYAALKNLNNVNGLDKYVGAVDISAYDSLFYSITETINDLANKMQNKAEDIKEYEEAPLSKKLAGSLFMGVAKAGEGLLSAFESIGDGIVSVVGWGAGKLGAKNFQESCAKFVEKDLSRGAFKWYYDSSLGKASFFTEESAIANAFKLTGKTIGTLYAGGVFAGTASGLGFGATKLGQGMLRVASSTTWGATTVGALSGIGSGTQAGLQAGLEFDDAYKVGVKAGAIQGGLAFLGGKLSEHAQAVKGGAKGWDAWKGNKTIDGKAIAKDGSNLVQGYTDKFTRAGYNFGQGLGMTVRGGIKTAVAGVKASRMNQRGGATKKANNALRKQLNASKKIRDQGLARLKKDNPLTQLIGKGTKVTNGLGAAKGILGVSIGTIASDMKGDFTNSGLIKEVNNSSNVFGTSNDSTRTTPTIETITTEPVTTTPTTTGETSTGTTSTGGTTGGSTGGSTGYYTGGGSTGYYTGGGYTTGESTGYEAYVEEPGSTQTSGPQVTPFETTAPTEPTTVATTPDTIPTVPDGPIDSISTVPQEVIPEPQPEQQPVPSPSPSPNPYQNPTPSQSQTEHSGTEYDGETLESDSLELDSADELDLLDEVEDTPSYMDEIVEGNSYTKLPTSSIPKQTTKRKSSNSAIPIAAGLSAAAAAGIGAKAYMDWKKNNTESDEYEEEDDIETEEWNEDENYSTDDNTPDYMKNIGEDELVEESYSATQNEYTARSNNELAEVQ